MTTRVSCSECGVTNRIPTERLLDAPKCGKCKAELFSGRVQDLNADTVSRVLNQNDLPVVVDCWAPWCGPCRSFAPVFQQAANDLEPHYRFAKLNTEQEQTVAARWNIRSIPTLLVFKNGKEVKRIAGALPPAQFKQWLTVD